MKFSALSGLAVVAVCGTLACSESTSPAGGRPITVSFTTAAAAGASLFRTTEIGASRDVSLSTGTDALVITSVQLVVARLELQRAGATCTSEAAMGDDDADENECAELELAPTLIDIPVNGTVLSVMSGSVPAGSYSALEAKIRPLRSDNEHGRSSAAFLTAHPELNGVSVVVDGTFNGTRFTYQGAPRVEFERTFNPPLVVDVAPMNLTVSMDLTTWFRTQSGALIDPSTANAGGPNAVLVAENIKRSFHAFRDDDRDGGDDDRRGHS
jgi:hypothetical protein